MNFYISFYLVGRRPDKLRALILTPTRELALQIRDHIQVHIESGICLIDNHNTLKIFESVHHRLVFTYLQYFLFLFGIPSVNKKVLLGPPPPFPIYYSRVSRLNGKRIASAVKRTVLRDSFCAIRQISWVAYPQKITWAKMSTRCLAQLSVLPFIFSGRFTIRAICRASTCDLKQRKWSNACGQKMQKKR